ncbi:hypothetical protein ABT213_08095 [Streptomyces sp. NPDC001674]|uniref:hypothetical protein n=1 Tax=Streptomyces sp. NPDC001674 TaxID=3154394 RepID=UPI00331873F9
MTTHTRAHDVLVPEPTDDDSPTRVTVIHTPSTELLARAHSAWHRFLDTFEAAHDE